MFRTMKFLSILIYLFIFQEFASAQVNWAELNQKEITLPYGIKKLFSVEDGSLFFDPLLTDRMGSVAIGDFNSDGIIDVAKSNLNPTQVGLYVFVSKQKTSHNIPTNQFIYGDSLLADDIDGDGNDDLIYPNRGRIYVRKGDGQGEFSTLNRSGFTSKKTNQILLADINADGNKDIVVVSNSLNRDNASSKIWLHFGDGTGEFKISQQVLIPTNTTSAAIFKDQNNLALALGGSRGHHSGQTGTFILPIVDGVLLDPQLISSKHPMALASGLLGQGLVGAEASTLFYFFNNQTTRTDFSPKDSFYNVQDIAVGLWGDDQDPAIAVLEVAGDKSNIRFFEIK